EIHPAAQPGRDGDRVQHLVVGHGGIQQLDVATIHVQAAAGSARHVPADRAVGQLHTPGWRHTRIEFHAASVPAGTVVVDRSAEDRQQGWGGKNAAAALTSVVVAEAAVDYGRALLTACREAAAEATGRVVVHLGVVEIKVRG